MNDIIMMDSMRAELRRQVDAAGGVKEFARAKGFGENHGCISSALSGGRDVTEAVANSIGYLRFIAFQKM